MEDDRFVACCGILNLRSDVFFFSGRSQVSCVKAKIESSRGSRNQGFEKSGFYCTSINYQPIDHLHYDIICARPDGSCSRPAETGPSVL